MEAKPIHLGFSGRTRARTLLRSAVAATAVLAGVVVASSASMTTASAATPVLSAQGSTLLVNGQPAHLAGVNARGLAGDAGVTSTCPTPNTDAQVSQVIDSLPSGAVVRFEAFQGGYATNPATDALDFTGIDRVFADAEARGVLLIPVLANEWGQCDEGVQKSLDWFNGGFTSLSPPALATAAGVPAPTLSYLSYVQAFVARYRSSPALAMYEPIGEPDASTCTGQATLDGCSAPWVCNETSATAALRHFYDTVGAAIDALDPQHLIEAGFGSNTACGLEGADLSTVAASTGIDVLSFHDYNGAIPLDTQPAGSSPSDEIGRAAAAGKPIIDAEVGIDASSTDPGCVTPTVRADELLHKEQAQFAAGVSGFLVWNESPAPSGTACDQTMTPGDPTLSSVVADPPGGPPAPASATNIADRSVAGLNFAGADLAGVNLAGYDLSNANFSGSNLTGADLDGAMVAGANFTGATLASVHAADLVGSATFSAGWSLVDGDLVGPGLSLTGDDLSGFDLTGISLAGADLDGAILDGTNLTGVDLSGTLLNGVTAQGVIGTPLLPAGWALLGGFLLGPGANLTGVTLPSGTLTNVDLFGATLSGADFRAVHLVHVASGAVVSYWSTQLPSGWSLEGGFLLGPSADLTDATLTGLDLSGVDLSQATLTGVVGRGLTGSPVLPASWVIRSGILLGPGANLVGVNLAGANLTGVNLSGANLSNVGLQGATLTGANLTGATLTGAVANGIQGCPTLGAGWVCGGGFLIGPGVNLAWSNIAGLNLTGVSLAGANLTGAALTNDNLTSADLSQATLTNVTSSGLTGAPTLPSGFAVLGGHLVGPTAQLAWDDLHGLNFTGVNLTGANLVGVNLAGANLTGVNLSGANLSNVGLQGATLTGANLTGATLTGAVANGIQGCPTLGAGWVCGGGFLIGPGVNLAWSNIAGLNLTGVSLAGANLTGAALTNDNLTSADLSQATLTNVTSSGLTGAPTLPSGFAVLGGHLVGPTAQLAWDDLHGLNFTGVNLTGANLVGVNLAGANLTGVNLSGANLSNVGLQGATLTGANLTGATLTGAVANGIQGCPTLGAGWVCGGGFLIGPGVNLAWSNIAGLNLTGVSLAGANLTGAALTNDNLTSADLSQATLTNVTSSGLTGAPTLPSGFAVLGGHLVGPTAQLAWDDLHGLNFTGVNLAGANLVGVNLAGANLTGVNLSGANLSGGVLVGTVLNAASLGTATLTGITSSGIQGAPASLPPGWSVVSGQLVGPH